MWIFFALGSLFTEAMETTVDKIALVRYNKIDPLAATFLRVFMVLLLVTACGVLGLLGPLKFLISWPIVIVAVLEAVASVVYTYLLKYIEASGYAAISFLSPLLFLIIDTRLLKTSLTVRQVAGIFLLTLGGIMFVVNPKKFELKKEFTPLVWVLFGFNLIFSIFYYYVFKHYSTTRGLNEVSYLFSFELLAVIFLLAGVLAWRRAGRLWAVFSQTRYFGAVFVSKTFDVATVYLWLHAIALASVSQVNAVGAFFPLTVIAVVYFAQNLFKFKAEENFSRGHLAFKVAGVILLGLGGYAVR